MASRFLHILHLNNRWEAGGVRRHILDLTRAMHGAGHRITIAAANAPESESDASLQYIDLPLYGRRTGVKSLSGLYRSMRTLEEIVGRDGVDIVHMHSRYVTLIGHYLSKRTDVRIVYTAHNQFDNLNFLQWSPEHLICPARSTRDSFLAGVPDPGRYVAHVIFHGIDMPPVATVPRERESGGLPQENVFSFIGRHVPEKGGLVLLEAARHLHTQIPSGWRLRFIGDGPCRREWSAMAEGWGLGGLVEFPGHLPDPWEVLRNSTALVVPSISKEGFGYVVLEAALSGVPVIASDIPLFRELAELGVRSVFFPVGDDKALAAIIRRVLVEGVSNVFGSAATMPDPELFSVERMARETMEVYELLMES
jgi:glycosyltransferase involved in cell wall biosynthesis